MQQNKIIIGLVIGLIIGAGVGYFIAPEEEIESQTLNYESLIEEYEEDIETLNSRINYEEERYETLVNRYNNLELDYNSLESDYGALIEQLNEMSSEETQTATLFNISGKSDKNTKPFTIDKSPIKITWEISKSAQYEWLHLALYDTETNSMVDYWTYLDKEPQGETYSYVPPGTYYLSVTTVGCNYYIELTTE